MSILDFSIESSHEGLVAGIDEAGRGPWAGPVVAAIAILDINRLPHGVNDSKQLTKVKREAFFEIILGSAHIGVGICSVEEVDLYNVLGATKHAMCRAYDALTVKPDIALVDGNQLPDLPCKMQAIIDGDALCMSIAAASIIAKVTRDRIMAELAKEFPHYGWERNAGYGTKQHQEGLAKVGICQHHRRSFAPIRAMLEKVAV